MTILADAGIPMIFIQMPAMVCALIPVILVETIVLSRKLSLGFSAALRGSASANIVSTLVGVPIAWCLMLGIEFSQYPVYVLGQKLGWNFNAPLFRIIGFVLSVSWLPPLGAGNRWLIPLAAALLLAPCFFVSVWIESKMCFRTWKHIEWRLLHRAVVAANLISYLCLTIVALACTWNKYYSPPKIQNVTTANLIKEETPQYQQLLGQDRPVAVPGGEKWEQPTVHASGLHRGGADAALAISAMAARALIVGTTGAAGHLLSERCR